jgi:hypothetical protein
MKTLTHPLALLAAGMLSVLTTEAAAGEGESIRTYAGQHPILNLKPRPSAPRTLPRARQISPETAAKIRSVLPEVVRTTPEADAGTDAQPMIVDDPSVVLMPKYFVNEDKVPAIKPRDTLDRDGRRVLGIKRHPGLVLNFGKYFYSWEEEIVQEEFAIERAKEISGMLGLSMIERAAVRQLSSPRPATWSETGGSYQAQRR